MKMLYRNSMLSLLAATAFAPGEAGWKLDEDGKIVLKDGNPVYLDASGREMTVEHGTIARLNGEAKSHRERAEAAETKLQVFKDIDPEAARKAIDITSRLDQKQLLDAGKVDELKNQITSQFTAQIAEKDKAFNDLKSQYDNSTIQNLFAGSDFIRDRVAVPRDMFEATFRQNFKIEDGKVAAYGRDGNRLLSKQRAGEFADPAEALELLVEQHPQKDVILRASDANGTGNGGNGGYRGGGRTMKRGEFEQLSPAKQSELASKMGAGEFQIVD